MNRRMLKWMCTWHRTGLFIEGDGVSLHQTQVICISIEKNYFALLSVIYNLQSCKIAPQNPKQQSVWNRQHTVFLWSTNLPCSPLSLILLSLKKKKKVFCEKSSLFNSQLNSCRSALPKTIIPLWHATQETLGKTGVTTVIPPKVPTALVTSVFAPLGLP